jgi:flavin reductase (DIM6/NTAB) family NADH-FMN oxidoreductase RutF
MTDIHAQLPPIDARTFWRTLGERATGMTIVTLLVSIDRKTTALGAVMVSRHFAVNYLPANAQSVADAFSGKTGMSGSARFREGDWTTLVTGAPVFKAALGAFDCRVEDIIQRGDISIIIGTAIGAVSIGAGEPLVFFRGKSMAGFGSD